MSTSTRVSMVVIFVLLSVVPSGLGQPAAAPGPDCVDSLTSLLPCLDFVTDAADNVSSECCTGLSDVRTSAPLCLCAFLNANGSDLGINVTRALQLPGLCGIIANPADCPGTPPVTPPTTAPAMAPSTPATPPTTAPATAPVVAPTVSPATPPPTVVPTPPTAECNSKLAELAPCLSFVTGKSAPPPSAACCSKFSDVVSTAPTCLCPLLSSSSDTTIPGLNSTLALQLPTFCQVQVDLGVCTGGTTPTTPSGGAPAPSAGEPGSFASVAAASPLLTLVLVGVVAIQLLGQMTIL